MELNKEISSHSHPEIKDLFVWTKDYETGIRVIDKQHKRLVKYINEFHESQKEGECNAILSLLFKRLIDYTEVHFETEENIMIANCYPDYEKHKAEHEELKKSVHKFYNDWLDGKTEFNDDLAKFLTKWLSHHILDVDMDYQPYIHHA